MWGVSYRDGKPEIRRAESCGRGVEFLGSWEPPPQFPPARRSGGAL